MKSGVYVCVREMVREGRERERKCAKVYLCCCFLTKSFHSPTPNFDNDGIFLSITDTIYCDSEVYNTKTNEQLHNNDNINDFQIQKHFDTAR